MRGLAGNEVSQLAEELAKVVLIASGLDSNTAEPWRVLRPLAGFLDLTVERCSELKIDGQMCRSDSGRKVQIAGSMTATRTVFTFAHELGHVILEDYAGAEVKSLCHEDVERLCDAIASALVIPSDWVERQLSGCVTLRDVLSIASLANVSPTAVAIRLKDMGHDVIMFRLKRLQKSGSWIVSTAVGLPHEARRAIHPRSDFASFLTRNRDESIWEISTTFETHDSCVLFPASVSAAGSGAYLLVNNASHSRDPSVGGRSVYTLKNHIAKEGIRFVVDPGCPKATVRISGHIDDESTTSHHGCDSSSSLDM